MRARTEPMSLTSTRRSTERRSTAAVIGAPRAESLRAPFSLRCGAMLIDYTLFVAVVAFATLLARAFGGGTQLAASTTLTFGYFAALSLTALNFVVLAGFSGCTVGKWVTGLRIERKDGAPLSFGRATLRHFIGYPMSLATLGLGFLLAAFNREGRALHDVIAGTTVARERKRARAARR